MAEILASAIALHAGHRRVLPCRERSVPPSQELLGPLLLFCSPCQLIPTQLLRSQIAVLVRRRQRGGAFAHCCGVVRVLFVPDAEVVVIDNLFR